MGKEILDDDKFLITAFAGAQRSDGKPNVKLQVLDYETYGFIVLDIDHMATLCRILTTQHNSITTRNATTKGKDSKNDNFLIEVEEQTNCAPENRILVIVKDKEIPWEYLRAMVPSRADAERLIGTFFLLRAGEEIMKI